VGPSDHLGSAMGSYLAKIKIYELTAFDWLIKVIFVGTVDIST